MLLLVQFNLGIKCVHTHNRTTNVYTQMTLQYVLIRKWLFTHTTGIWLLSSISLLMFLQTILVSEFLLYTLQVSGHSPVRRHSWFFRILWYVNNLLHTSQEYACSPVHIHSGVFRWQETINDFLNILQLYDHFPITLWRLTTTIAVVPHR